MPNWQQLADIRGSAGEGRGAVLSCCFDGSPRALQGETAVDHVDSAGGEGRFIRGEIDGEGGDLLRPAEPAHRLALDKAAPLPPS